MSNSKGIPEAKYEVRPESDIWRWRGHSTRECSACRQEMSFSLGKDGGIRLCGHCCAVIMGATYNALYRRSLKWSGYGIQKPNQRVVKTPTARQRQSVHRRDNYTCRYCGEQGGNLTVDHVDPKGPQELSNFVTACQTCNGSKNNRTPAEAGMELLPLEEVRRGGGKD